MEEKKLYLLIKEILDTHGDIVDDLHIVDVSEFGDDEEFRIYHGDGYCFDVKKEYACEPDEVDSFEEVDKDGFSYSTYFGWDGFKECTLDKAKELLEEYAKID
jgi:hypothetical protein